MKIVNAILSKLDNIHIQLEHNSAETTWEKHGEVAIKLLVGENNDGESALTKIVYDEDFQHNRNYSSMTKRAESFADLVEEFMNSDNKKRGETGETVSLTEDYKS